MLLNLKLNRVLVGTTLKVLNFLEFLRKKMKIDESSGMFLFVNDSYLVKASKCSIYFF